MAAVRERLWVKTAVGGCARYEGDAYERATSDPSIPGNPWIICTLWLARHAIEAAVTPEEIEQARPLLDWVAAHAAPSGVLPEQVDPFDGTPRSVVPLTWSHAELVFTVRRLIERRAELTAPAQCSQRKESPPWTKP
jgi:GH15 family glucan-1,4-alpha-glucosidase